MSWLAKIVKKLKDANSNFSEADIHALTPSFSKPIFNDHGIYYPNKSTKKIKDFSSTLDWACSSESNSQQALYLAQLCDEKIATIEDDAILLTWEDAYYLFNSDEHSSSIPLLLLPSIKHSTLNVDNKGTLSDQDFQIRINGILR